MLPGVVREPWVPEEGSKQRQWMGGHRFTIARWVTLSKSLNLSEPTFFLSNRDKVETCPPVMGEVDSVECYRHMDKEHEGIRDGGCNGTRW